jgi:hypothetical protein
MRNVCVLTHKCDLSSADMKPRCSEYSKGLQYGSTTYEGVSKSFRTESIRKYTLTSGITRCCHLPSLCNGSSVSATAATDFLESLGGRSAIVPEFQ